MPPIEASRAGAFVATGFGNVLGDHAQERELLLTHGSPCKLVSGDVRERGGDLAQAGRHVRRVLRASVVRGRKERDELSEALRVRERPVVRGQGRLDVRVGDRATREVVDFCGVEDVRVVNLRVALDRRGNAPIGLCRGPEERGPRTGGSDGDTSNQRRPSRVEIRIAAREAGFEVGACALQKCERSGRIDVACAGVRTEKVRELRPTRDPRRGAARNEGPDRSCVSRDRSAEERRNRGQGALRRTVRHHVLIDRRWIRSPDFGTQRRGRYFGVEK